MHSAISDHYFDTEVLTASPAKLIQLMYRGALEAISAARVALQTGDIPARSHQITKASAIINELALSLDHSQHPELCKNLVELYDYMLRRLIAANAEQTEDPLIETEGLLQDLLGAWREAAETSAEGGHVQGMEVARNQFCSEPEYQRLSYAC